MPPSVLLLKLVGTLLTFVSVVVSGGVGWGGGACCTSGIFGGVGVLFMFGESFAFFPWD